MAELVFFRRREERFRVRLSSGSEIVVGRGGASDVIVPDSEISAVQFRIRGESSSGSETFTQKDLSGNGTRVAGKSADQTSLSDGDEIALGQWSVFFHRNSDAGNTSAFRVPARSRTLVMKAVKPEITSAEGKAPTNPTTASLGEILPSSMSCRSFIPAAMPLTYRPW